MKKVLCLLVSLLLIGACNPFGCGEREERYFVAIELPKEGTSEITFNRKLSECVNGIESDDFASQCVEVEETQLSGATLRQIKWGYPPAYVADGYLDRKKPIFSFSRNGISDISDLDSVTQKGRQLIVQMRPFPPK